MADYTYYYLQTFLSPLLVLTVSLCVLRYCCRFCRTDRIEVDLDTDLDLSNSDRVFVIPIPERAMRDERDESDSDEDSDYRPPPYELVCQPPSYAESSLKLNISNGQDTPHSEMETSHESPPPPYAPPLFMTSQSDQQ